MSLADLPAVAFEDDLTGLFNRRYLQRYLSTQIDWNPPAAKPCSFLVVDIDAFHRVNDRYGREEGDFVLQGFADRLRKAFRPDDVVARDGGDSFFVVLPHTSKNEAVRLAERLLEDLRKRPLRTRRDRFIVELTASAAVVSLPEDGAAEEAVRDAAEKVLFHAKQSGRDRVSVGGRIDEELAAGHDPFAGLPCRTLCGRQAEFQATLGSLDRLAAGQPSTLFVQGPAGIGKSRFLREIAAAATTRDVFYLYVICNESQRLSPGHALLYLVDQYYRLHPEARADLHECLFAAQRRVARELIASLSSWPEEETEAQPRDRKALLLGLLETAVRSMARRSPLLILIDNARHCDPGTLAVLQRLQSDRRTPVAIVFSLKGDVRKIDPKSDPALHAFVEDLERAGVLEALTLVPLKREDVAQMVQSILPNSNAQRDFEELLYARSQGNPLYVEEAIRALLLRQRIVREGARYELRGISPDDLPPSLDAVIAQVLATLPPEAGELVTNAAVIGTRFDVQELQEVMGKREGETLDAVDQVENARLVEHLSQGTADDYAFRSSTTRDARYVTTAEEAKKLIHRRLANIARAHGPRAADLTRAEHSFHAKAAGLPPPPGEADELPVELPLEAAKPAAAGRAPRIPECTAPLSGDSLRRAYDFMRALTALLRIGRLYPQWSQTSTQFSRQLQESAAAFLAEAGGATFAADSRGVTLNGQPTDPNRSGGAVADFGALLADRLVASLTFAGGLEPRELDALVAALAAPLDRSRAPSDHWDRFLDREGIRHIDILQRRYVALEGRTRVLRRRPPEHRALSAEELGALQSALRRFKAACDNLRLYPPGHALVESSIADAVQSFTDLLSRLQVLALAASDEGLLVNGHPTEVRTVGDGGALLSTQLARRDLKSLVLWDGLRPDEIQALVSVFAVPADDPTWRGVLKALAAESGTPNFEFGGLQYAQLTAGAGAPGEIAAAVVPSAPDPAAEFRVARAMGGAAPAAPAEPQEELPFSVATVRADVRARAYLKAPPERFLAEDFEREFAPLMEILNYGWTVQLAGQLASRLAGLVRDANPAFRERALRIVARGLAETTSPGARGLIVSRTDDALDALVPVENDPSVLPRAAETIPAWIGAALSLGRFDAVSDILTAVRKRAEAGTTPAEFRSSILAKLSELAGPKGPLVDALKVASEPSRDAVLRISGMFGPSMIPVLVEFIAESDNADHRRLAALALKDIGGNAFTALAALVAPDGKADRILRVLSVVQLAGATNLAAPVAAAMEHPDPGVRAAAFIMLRRAERPIAVATLRRLIAPDSPQIAMAVIALAADLGFPEVGLEVTRLAQFSEDNALVRACCDYFVRVRVPAALPALRRIFAARGRMFGLVKGFPDEIRALAVRAAAAIPHEDAATMIEQAKRDRSPEVRKAAGPN